MAPKKQSLGEPSIPRDTPGRDRKQIARFADEPSQSSRRQSAGGASKPRLTPQQKRELQIKEVEARLGVGSEAERCGAILDLLNLRADAYWFDQPVPVDMVPDYPEVIATPMDYATVRSKLDAGDYGGEPILQFAADVRLIFMNAVKYNWKPDHDCHIAAKACLRAFEHYLGRARGIDVGPPLGSDAAAGAAAGGKAAKGSGSASGAGRKRKSSIGTPGAASTPGAAGAAATRARRPRTEGAAAAATAAARPRRRSAGVSHSRRGRSTRASARRNC